ncbi:MAG: ureidoglycolate lyase [Pseudomonadota bacterium]
MPKVLTPQALTRQAFQPYGEVVEVTPDLEPELINEGHTQKFGELAKIHTEGSGGFPQVNIFRSNPKKNPITIQVMECHPLGSQCFIPLSNKPYLVVVHEAGRFDPKAIAAFVATGKQGVNYSAGTWHHYLLALEEESDFLVIDRGGPGDIVAEIRLEQEIEIAA